MTNCHLTHWKKTFLTPTATLQHAIQNLAETGLQIVLVVSDDGVLQGTITDGDVRRSLLRGAGMETPIEAVMFRTPLVAPPEMAQDMILHLMKANKILQLPVVDADHRVVGLHFWDEVASPATRSNLMIVMAGGFGKRLRPYTEDCPKPMLPVAGKPILEHIIERARDEGFSRFVLAVQYLGHMIESHFGDGNRLGVEIDYLREDVPLGTVGALSLLDSMPERPFVVTNGDVLTDIRYGELLDFHQWNHADATMAVRQHEWEHPFGVVKTRGIDIVGFEEKPVHRTHVNAGIYVLGPEALEFLGDKTPCDMPTLFERLQSHGKKIIAYPMHEPWLDVGRPADLEQARANTVDIKRDSE